MAEEIRLSKSFIETELPQAPPLYVSVYLMTLAIGQDAKKVAERLKATETDVLYAWGYWKGKGYLAGGAAAGAAKTCIGFLGAPGLFSERIGTLHKK